MDGWKKREREKERKSKIIIPKLKAFIELLQNRIHKSEVKMVLGLNWMRKTVDGNGVYDEMRDALM